MGKATVKGETEKIVFENKTGTNEARAELRRAASSREVNDLTVRKTTIVKSDIKICESATIRNSLLKRAKGSAVI